MDDTHAGHGSEGKGEGLIPARFAALSGIESVGQKLAEATKTSLAGTLDQFKDFGGAARLIEEQSLPIKDLGAKLAESIVPQMDLSSMFSSSRFLPDFEGETELEQAIFEPSRREAEAEAARLEAARATVELVEVVRAQQRWLEMMAEALDGLVANADEAGERDALRDRLETRRARWNMAFTVLTFVGMVASLVIALQG